MNRSILTLVVLLFCCAASAQDVTINGKLNFVNTNAYMVGVAGVDYLDVRGVNDEPILRFNRNTLDAYFLAGKVGIGTNAPLYSLDIRSIGTPSSTTLHLGANGSDGGLYLSTNTHSSSGAYISGGAAQDAAASAWIAKATAATLLGSYDGNVRIFANTGLTSGAAYAPSERFTILGSNGNVGMGTATPSEKLCVNGKIRAHELKIEVANWPDYVFAPSHKLRSLGEVEHYIKQNNRLPEIPSAAEAEKNGIEVGEINKLLLKKVEELTLYLIDLQKEVNALKNKIEK